MSTSAWPSVGSSSTSVNGRFDVWSSMDGRMVGDDASEEFEDGKRECPGSEKVGVTGVTSEEMEDCDI
jgi:hypothetical protein